MDMRKCCDYELDHNGKIVHSRYCEFRPPSPKFDPSVIRQHLQDTWDFWEQRIKDENGRTARQVHDQR